MGKEVGRGVVGLRVGLSPSGVVGSGVTGLVGPIDGFIGVGVDTPVVGVEKGGEVGVGEVGGAQSTHNCDEPGASAMSLKLT